MKIQALLLLFAGVASARRSLRRSFNGPPPSPSPYNVIGLQLMDVGTGQAIGLSNGQVIDISAHNMSYANFNVNAVVSKLSSVNISSVLFGFQGNTNYHNEGSAPYALCGDSGGTFNTCPEFFFLGNFTVSATAYSNNIAAKTLTVSFTLINSKPITRVAQGPADSSGGRWISINMASNITARHEACFVMSGRKAYLIGGRGNKPTNIYDPVSRNWTSGAAPPIQLHHMQCVALDGKIWAVSPWTGWFPYENTTDYAYVYDTATDQWSTRTALPLARRRGSAAAIVVGRRIYVSHGNIGGHETNDNHATSYGWLDYYDVDTDKWTTNLPDAPTPRDHAGGILIGNSTICIAAGRNGGEPNWPDLAPTDCFDLTTNSWTVRASIPQMRGGASYGTSCDGKLMIAGGEGFGKAWQNVDVFDGKQWTSMAPMVQGRHGVGLAVDCQCQQIHIASGAGNQGDGPELYSVETYFFGGADQPCLA